MMSFSGGFEHEEVAGVLLLFGGSVHVFLLSFT